MAGSELRIDLARREPRFRPGEPIRGTVRVSTADRCHCDELNIGLQWRTHGKGNVVKGRALRQVLFVGDWQAGQNEEYPFVFEAPAGPLTYRGTLFNVDWYLAARADVPWAADPKDETELLLVPWTESAGLPEAFGGYRSAPVQPWEDYVLGSAVVLPHQAMASQAAKARRVLGGGLLCAAVGLVLVLGPAKVPGLVCLAGAAFLLGSYGRAWLARRSLGGTPTVRVEPPIVEAGSNISVTVRFAPSRAIELESASVNLSAAEVVVRGSGTDKQTYTHVLHSDAAPLARAGRVIAPGEDTELVARFAIPADAEITFAATDNQVRWSVKVVVDAKAAPAWKVEIPFVVRPRFVS